MTRTYRVTKTRQAKPKITLYENGQVMLARPVSTDTAGHNLGRAWEATARTTEGATK